MILNRQRNVRVPVKELQKFLLRACRRLALPADALTVCCVTEAQIARWNRWYRGKNRPTDVLSFAANAPKRKRGSRKKAGSPLAGSALNSTGFVAASPGYLGDIAIAPGVARRNARRFGRTLDQEMRILILHGMLHLMGYDHEADHGQMDRREQRLRRALGLA